MNRYQRFINDSIADITQAYRDQNGMFNNSPFPFRYDNVPGFVQFAMFGGQSQTTTLTQEQQMAVQNVDGQLIGQENGARTVYILPIVVWVCGIGSGVRRGMLLYRVHATGPKGDFSRTDYYFVDCNGRRFDTFVEWKGSHGIPEGNVVVYPSGGQINADRELTDQVDVRTFQVGQRKGSDAINIVRGVASVCQIGSFIPGIPGLVCSGVAAAAFAATEAVNLWINWNFMPLEEKTFSGIIILISALSLGRLGYKCWRMSRATPVPSSIAPDTATVLEESPTSLVQPQGGNAGQAPTQPPVGHGNLTVSENNGTIVFNNIQLGPGDVAAILAACGGAAYLQYQSRNPTHNHQE